MLVLLKLKDIKWNNKININKLFYFFDHLYYTLIIFSLFIKVWKNVILPVVIGGGVVDVVNTIQNYKKFKQII